MKTLYRSTRLVKATASPGLCEFGALDYTWGERDIAIFAKMRSRSPVCGFGHCADPPDTPNPTPSPKKRNKTTQKLKI